MARGLALISTDFDGTLHSDGETPPVPAALQQRLASLQASGVRWVINTGRDLESLREGLERASMSVRPDFLVTVEREIHVASNGDYAPLREWNEACAAEHRRLFGVIAPQLAPLRDWIAGRFNAAVYEDEFSPFCLIAQSNADADAIEAEFARRFAGTPALAFVRNDVYARLSHVDYNKGTALGEIGRRCNLSASQTLAAGDHFNDLPMLQQQFAFWLVAPGNAVSQVKAQVRLQQGFISSRRCGWGVLEGLDWALGGRGG